MPASAPQDIRNVVFLGHGGAGKTSLGESILYAAKLTTRLGSVADGTTVLDFSDIEKERGHSVDPSMAFLDYKGKTINIIDAPGYPDFIGGAIAALSGADIAVIFVSATAGIEVNTRKLFKIAQDAGMPIALVVNKIDGENVNLERLMGEIQETFGSACKPMDLPVQGGKAVVDDFKKESGDADFSDVATAHTQLIESIIEADEPLMESYLAGEPVSIDKLVGATAKAMVAGTVIPVFFTAATNSVGVMELMDDIAEDFPSPLMVPGLPVTSGPAPDSEKVPVVCDPSKPFIGQAFKTTTDPFVGKLAWIRVLQGTVTGDTMYFLGDHKKTAKIGHLFKVFGKEAKEVKQAIAGDIVALAKVEDIHAGDVLHVDPHPMFRGRPRFPTPMYSLAITPKSRGDEQKISEALQKLTQEDATFQAHRDAQTSETVISGVGDLHLRIMLTKMHQRFDMDVDTKQPKIPYRETITAKADGHHRHKKQTGGSGQFGEVFLRVEPLERGWSQTNGSPYEYISELFGESIPRQYLPAIEKGVADVMVIGAVAGYPMQDIRVAITDGKYHPVDSKEIAFRTAGKFALIDAIQKARPAILEPIVNMEITVPAHYMGDIASDLSGRRGRIMGQDMLPGNMVVVKAQAPLAEVMQYNSQLRSVTAGQGSYSMELSHYEPVPSNVQAQIVAAHAKEKEEEKE